MPFHYHYCATARRPYLPNTSVDGLLATPQVILTMDDYRIAKKDISALCLADPSDVTITSLSLLHETDVPVDGDSPGQDQPSTSC